MSPAQILERSYQTLKQRLIDGGFRPGQRLEAARLADDMHVSITPVRDVLNRLTGEGLVEAIAGGGFYVQSLDESVLRDLLDWNAALALLAMRKPRSSIGSVTTLEHDASDVPERTARLFLRLALRQCNSEFTRAVESANDRLHAMRQLDERVIGKTSEELAELESAAETATASALAKHVRKFHARRKGRLATYIRLLRTSPPYP
ncbi:GntR family transcriptional regulator [Sphingobium aquiterrae]|uniref:GntR family transcriptional regulator n=1 Tax=Sphingobium aquiterrae TaxID=2038656 RepID=UPI0030196729